MKCNFKDCGKEEKKLYPLVDGETLKEIKICEKCYREATGHYPNDEKGSLRELFGRG